MSNKALLRSVLLAIGAVLTVVLIAALGMRATKAEDEVESLDLSGAGSVAEPDVASSPASERSRTVMQLPEPAPSAEVPAPGNSPAPTRVWDQIAPTYEKKYAGSTLEQLIAAKSVLEDRRDVDRDRILKELIAANRLVEVPVDADGKRSLKGNKDGSPTSFTQTFDLVDGVTVSKAAVIKGEEYPEYRALELEVWWLEY